MRKVLVVFYSLAMLALIGGCGGGGDRVESSPAPGTNTTSSLSASASSYTGSWSGTLDAGGGSSSPITLSLIGLDVANTVTGTISSMNLSGTFTGTVDSTSGRVIGAVTNMIDGNTWDVQLGVIGSGLNIVKVTYGAASLGTGSCTATPVLAVDMSGSWKGTIVQKNVTTGFTVVGTTQNVAVDLAYDGAGGFVGAITGDKGLVARIKFIALAGYWACYIDRAVSWGTVIPVPQNDTLLTQGMITSAAAMIQSFATNQFAPAAMTGIILSGWHPTGTYAPNGAEYIDYTEFSMSLTR